MTDSTQDDLLTRQWSDVLSVEDALAWQKMVDSARSSVNLNGSIRFWQTVEHYLECQMQRDSAPGFREIIIELAHGLGLKLTADVVYTYRSNGYITPVTASHGVMHWRFVPLKYNADGVWLREDDGKGDVG